MHTTVTTTLTAPARLLRRASAMVAIAAVGMALIAAGPAHADIKQGDGPAKGCPVENSDGTTTTVEVGTRIGLFVCGEDGEWHFGWLITGVSGASVHHKLKVLPVSAEAVRGGVSRAAQR
jgi:hypothetical protein